MIWSSLLPTLSYSAHLPCLHTFFSAFSYFFFFCSKLVMFWCLFCLSKNELFLIICFFFFVARFIIVTWIINNQVNGKRKWNSYCFGYVEQQSLLLWCLDVARGIGTHKDPHRSNLLNSCRIPCFSVTLHFEAVRDKAGRDRLKKQC